MDTRCEKCHKVFDAFTANARFCMECGIKRQERRSKLQYEKKLIENKLEKVLGTPLPCHKVEGWEELMLEDLANPFVDSTEMELCRKYGVKITDFYEFKVKMGLDVFAQTLASRSEKYRDQEGIYFRKMLVKQAKTQPNATLIGLQMTGQYNKKTLENDPLSGLSEEAKDKELQALLSKLNHK
jgi:hypothetical protein